MNPEEELSKEKPEVPPRRRARPGRTKVLLLAVLILAIPALLWSGYAYMDIQDCRDGLAPVLRTVPRKNPVMAFDPFLIPLGEKARYAFISLSFSLELSSGLSGKEMKEKMSELRGAIYRSLKEEFQNAEGIPLFQAVKETIDRAVRPGLPGQQVKEIYISQFLAL